MADIKARTAAIKQQLGRASGIDSVEMLARLCEDDSIDDSGGGNPLQKRLLTILNASADTRNGGLTHFSGILAGWDDTGFRKAFQDPWGAASNNQAGHFLTAVDMGSNPKRTYDYIVSTNNRFVIGALTIATGLSKEESICIRLIVGHEQYPDNEWQAGVMQGIAAKDQDIRAFYNAVNLMPNDPVLDVEKARGLIQSIPIGTGVGNSIQDLLLSLFGYKFGSRIRAGNLADLDEAAQWIRTNLAGTLPDVPSPAPTDAALA